MTQERPEIIYHITIQKIVSYIQVRMIMIHFRDGIKPSMKKIANLQLNIWINKATPYRRDSLGFYQAGIIYSGRYMRDSCHRTILALVVKPHKYAVKYWGKLGMAV